jgi:hypothetical protein
MDVCGNLVTPLTSPGILSVGAGFLQRINVGTQKTFQLFADDTTGALDLGIVNILINGAIDGRRACYLAYQLSTNTLYLVDDAGDSGGPFAGTMPLTGSSSSSIQNSQCIVLGTSSAVPLGSSVSLTLNVIFKASFVGNRIVYMAARNVTDSANTGWQPIGVWSVN